MSHKSRKRAQARRKGFKELRDYLRRNPVELPMEVGYIENVRVIYSNNTKKQMFA